MFCFDKLHYLVAFGDILEQNFFGIHDSDCLVDNNSPHLYQMILKYFYS